MIIPHQYFRKDDFQCIFVANAGYISCEYCKLVPYDLLRLHYCQGYKEDRAKCPNWRKHDKRRKR